MMVPDDLTDDDIVKMSDQELEAWAESQSAGPWEPNDVEPSPRPRMVSITLRMPQDLLAELRTEAAVRQQPYQRYMRDLLLLALRQVQAAGRRTAAPAQVRLTDDQLSELNDRGELTLQLRRTGS